MQHFDFDVEAIRLMLMRCFGKSMSACMGKPGDHYCNYRLNTSSLSSTWDIEKELKSLLNDVAASKEPVLYFVAGSDNKTRKSLVDGRELLATSLTPADILYLARQRGVNMPEMVVEKALPGQRGLLVRTNITK